MSSTLGARYLLGCQSNLDVQFYGMWHGIPEQLCWGHGGLGNSKLTRGGAKTDSDIRKKQATQPSGYIYIYIYTPTYMYIYVYAQTYTYLLPLAKIDLLWAGNSLKLLPCEFALMIGVAALPDSSAIALLGWSEPAVVRIPDIARP